MEHWINTIAMEKRNKEHTGEAFKEENISRTQRMIFCKEQGWERLENDSKYLG